MAKSETLEIILIGETIKGGTKAKPETYGDGDTVTVPSDLGNRLIARKRAKLAPSKAAKAAAPVAAPAADTAATATESQG